MKIIKPYQQPHRQLQSSKTGLLYSTSLSLSEALGFEKMSIYHEFLEPQHFSSAQHTHSHKREAFYLLSGHLLAHYDGLVESLSAGEMILFEPGEKHQLLNPGPKSAEYLIFAEIFEQDTVHFPA